VKGTKADTVELPKGIVRAAVSEGKLTHSQLIWNPADNAWKQVRELPDLLPSQKLAPAPSPSRAAGAPVPKAVGASHPESPAGPVARAVAASAGTPRVRVAASAGTPAVKAEASDFVPSTKGFVVKVDDSSHPLKWVCIGLGILILLGLGVNYLLVDQPLVSNLAQTSYSKVTVYAHFGAFMQPNVLVIHIPASSTITPDNLTDFLVALAQSTPQSPITRDLYARVALTSGWTAQYSFSGYSWKELGDMQREDEAQRKEFLLDQMGDAGGQSLIPESTSSEAARQAGRDQTWDAFVARFTAKR
jgi:hypothetical protein